MNLNNRKNFLSAFIVIAIGGAIFLWMKSVLPDRLFPEVVNSSSIVMDSLMLEAMNEQIENIPEPVPVQITTDSLAIEEIETPQLKQPAKKINYTPVRLMQVSDVDFTVQHPMDSTGLMVVPLSRKQRGYKGSTYLKSFFQKLKVLEQDSSQTVRIAYYGDSMIDGDLIVQDLRSALQTRFGGRGVGFVSIQSESARSRYSVKHGAYGNWEQHTFMKSVSDSNLYGVNGAVFTAQDSLAGVEFKASGIKNAYRLNSPKLFYGKGNDSARLKFQVDKDTIIKELKLDGKQAVNSIALSSRNLKKLNADFSNATGVPIYGMDFFNEQGITIDGFSNRGNSGLPLDLLKEEMVREFQQELDYDLIVLQFGANVLSTKTQSFGWYARRMKRVVSHLKTLFPETPILIMGTADKGSKIDETIKTDSTVVRLLRSQQQFASETQSGFLSLFHLMGGVNSMPAWRDHKLANADYTHLSPKGSRKMGRLIFAALMDDYTEYLSQNPEIKDEPITTEKDSASVKTDSLLNKPTSTELQEIPRDTLKPKDDE